MNETGNEVKRIALRHVTRSGLIFLDNFSKRRRSGFNVFESIDGAVYDAGKYCVYKVMGWHYIPMKEAIYFY